MKGKWNPKSERAMREAIRRWDAVVERRSTMAITRKYGPDHTVEYWDTGTGSILAIFDLRDCYRKRKPTKGISKKVLALLKGKK